MLSSRSGHIAGTRCIDGTKKSTQAWCQCVEVLWGAFLSRGNAVTIRVLIREYTAKYPKCCSLRIPLKIP